MGNLSKPHDKLVRETLGRKDTARDFLKNYLPSHLLELINLDSLEISKDSFIEKELKEFYSDILYKVRFKNDEGFLYLLFEHKSHKPELIQLQLLGYIHQIFCLHVKQKKAKHLPIIIPMVLYHGKTKWEFGTRLSSVIKGPCDLLKEYIPDFRFVLFDLTQYSDDQIKGHVVAKAFMMVLKHMSQGDIFEKLPDIFSLFRGLSENDTGLQYLETLLRYLFGNIEDKDMDMVKDILEKTISEEKGGSIMTTIAERFRNEGMQQGLQQGMNKGMRQGMQQGMHKGIQQGMQQGIAESAKEAVLETLDIRFGFAPKSISKRINSISDVSVLKKLRREAITKSSIEEFELFFDAAVKGS